MKWLSLFLVLCMSSTSVAGELILSEEGEVTVQPDVAYLRLGVSSESLTADASFRANKASLAKIYDTLTNMKIPRTDIQTYDFSLSPKYVYEAENPVPNPNPVPKLKGYITSNQVQITVKNTNQLGELLDALVQDGANKISGISFGLKDSKDALQEARTLAVKNLKSKIDFYTQNLGVKVVKYKSINESLGNFRRSMPMKASAVADAMPVSGGELTFKVVINAVLETE